jgi:hypothetical protein
MAAFIQWFGVPVGAVVISVVYFFMARTLSIGRRLAVSAHGCLLAAMYIFVGLIYETGHSHPSFAWPFLATFLAPAASVVFALTWYPRSKKLHFLLIPLLYCALWVAFIGGMAVTGDWL